MKPEIAISCRRFCRAALFSYLCGPCAESVAGHRTMKITNQNLLLVVIILFVTGALMRRIYPIAGLVIMACALLFYVFCGARRTLRTLSDFSGSPAKSKVLALVWLGMLLLVANVLWVIFWEGSVSYFLVLVLLAADFLVHQNSLKNGKE